MAEKNIQESVLWVIDSKVSERSGGGTELRVMRWLIDGKPTKPTLEKRDWFLNEDGQRKPGKAKGLTAYDLATVIRNLRKICPMLEMNVDALDEALQLAMLPPSASKSKPEMKSDSAPKTPSPSSGGTIPDVDF